MALSSRRKPKGGIETSVVINRPIDEVFAYVSNYENSLAWMTEVVEVKRTSEGPVGVGATYRDTVQFLGRRIENTNSEVTEYEPNRKFAIKTTSGPLPGAEEYTFDSVAGGTKVTRVTEAETGGFFRLAEPIIARMAQRLFEANSANLKELLEAQA